MVEERTPDDMAAGEEGSPDELKAVEEDVPDAADIEHRNPQTRVMLKLRAKFRTGNRTWVTSRRKDTRKKKTWCRINLNSPGRILNLATGKTSVPSCMRSCRKGMRHKGKRPGNYWSRQPQSVIIASTDEISG